MASAVMYILEPETITIPLQSCTQTVVSLPVRKQSEKMQQQYLICYPVILNRCPGIRLVVAPIWLRKRFLKLIERETKYARAGKTAKIVAKMNSLCDRDIIAALYEASAAGVQIDLVVRGICCLKVGIPEDQ